MGVTGIGGIFFRSRDPDALSAWYREHLGVGAGCNESGDGDPADWYWRAQGGPTVFAPFPSETDYWAGDKAFMLNLRVSDLEAMMSQLATAGIPMETRPDWNSPETGRFARIHDPEGNAIELWEPPTAA